MEAPDSWYYRRLIVFVITIAAVLMPFLDVVSPEIYWPYYTLASSAVGAYIGFATWEYRGRLSHVNHRPVNPDM